MHSFKNDWCHEDIMSTKKGMSPFTTIGRVLFPEVLFVILAAVLSITLSTMNEEPEGENLHLMIVNTACASVMLLSIFSVFKRKAYPMMKENLAKNINYAHDELYQWTEKEEADETWAAINAKSARSSKRASIVMKVYIVAIAVVVVYSLVKVIIDAVADKFSASSITFLICYAIVTVPLVLLIIAIENFILMMIAVDMSESIVKDVKKASRRDNWPSH